MSIDTEHAHPSINSLENSKSSMQPTAEKTAETVKPAITPEDLQKALELAPKAPGAVVAAITERMFEAHPERAVLIGHDQEMAFVTGHNGERAVTHLIKQGEGDDAVYVVNSTFHDNLSNGDVKLTASPDDVAHCDVNVHYYRGNGYRSANAGERGWHNREVEDPARITSYVGQFARDMFKSEQNFDPNDTAAARQWVVRNAAGKTHLY